MRLGGVGEDHDMVGLAVLEEVEDPFFFHDPAGEVEIALAILHAVIAFLESAVQFRFDVEVGENLFEDLGNGQVLENARLNSFRQQPELRNEDHPVGSESRVAARLGHRLADAVEVPLRLAVGHDQLDGDLLADELIEGDVLPVLGQQFELKLVWLGNCLAGPEGGQEKRIVTERGFDGQPNEFG